MKKILLIVVVCCLALLFGGCAGKRPEVLTCPPDCEEIHAVLRLNGLGELEELRALAGSSDGEAVQAYLQRLGDKRITREDLASCVEMLDALPYLPVLEGEITSIEYYPRIPDLAVTVQAANGDAVTLYYQPGLSDPEGYLQGGTGRLPTPFSCCGGRVTVYREERKRELGEDGRDYIVWETVTDGIYLRVFYYTDEPERIVMEEVFSGLPVRAEYYTKHPENVVAEDVFAGVRGQSLADWPA